MVSRLALSRSLALVCALALLTSCSVGTPRPSVEARPAGTPPAQATGPEAVGMSMNAVAPGGTLIVLEEPSPETRSTEIVLASGL